MIKPVPRLVKIVLIALLTLVTAFVIYQVGYYAGEARGSIGVYAVEGYTDVLVAEAIRSGHPNEALIRLDISIRDSLKLVDAHNDYVGLRRKSSFEPLLQEMRSYWRKNNRILMPEDISKATRRQK